MNLLAKRQCESSKPVYCSSPSIYTNCKVPGGTTIKGLFFLVRTTFTLGISGKHGRCLDYNNNSGTYSNYRSFSYIPSGVYDYQKTRFGMAQPLGTEFVISGSVEEHRPDSASPLSHHHGLNPKETF